MPFNFIDSESKFACKSEAYKKCMHSDCKKERTHILSSFTLFHTCRGCGGRYCNDHIKDLSKEECLVELKAGKYLCASCFAFLTGVYSTEYFESRYEKGSTIYPICIFYFESDQELLQKHIKENVLIDPNATSKILYTPCEHKLNSNCHCKFDIVLVNLGAYFGQQSPSRARSTFSPVAVINKMGEDSRVFYFYGTLYESLKAHSRNPNTSRILGILPIQQFSSIGSYQEHFFTNKNLLINYFTEQEYCKKQSLAGQQKEQQKQEDVSSYFRSSAGHQTPQKGTPQTGTPQTGTPQTDTMKLNQSQQTVFPSPTASKVVFSGGALHTPPPRNLPHNSSGMNLDPQYLGSLPQGDSSLAQLKTIMNFNQRVAGSDGGEFRHQPPSPLNLFDSPLPITGASSAQLQTIVNFNQDNTTFVRVDKTHIHRRGI